MKDNSITSAPAVDETAYNRWCALHGYEAEDAFFNFITTPSAERSAFLSHLDCSIANTDGIVTPLYRV